MRYFIFLDKITEKIEENCASCGFFVTNSITDDECDTYPVPDSHRMIEITDIEYDTLAMRSIIVERDGNTLKFENLYDLTPNDTIKGSQHTYQPVLEPLSGIGKDRIKLSERHRKMIGDKERPEEIVEEKEKVGKENRK